MLISGRFVGLNISDMRLRTPFLVLLVVLLRVRIPTVVLPAVEFTYSLDGAAGRDSEGSA